MFNNMKIKVENNLDEIVMELERLGCSYSGDGFNKDDFYVCVARTRSGWQWATTSCRYVFDFFDGKTTTLAELKEM